MPSMVLFNRCVCIPSFFNIKYAVGKARKHTLRHRLVNANSEDGIRRAWTQISSTGHVEILLPPNCVAVARVILRFPSLDASSTNW
jgi:hypothetical protein